MKFNIGVCILGNSAYLRYTWIGLGQRVRCFDSGDHLDTITRAFYSVHDSKTPMVTVLIKCSVAAGIMGVAVHFGYEVLYRMIGIVPVALLLDICIGVGVYGLVILFMRIKEVDFVMAWLHRKVKRVR